MNEYMDGMMSMMSWPMMVGMGLFWVLVLLVLVLAAVALIKYLMSGRRS